MVASESRVLGRLAALVHTERDALAGDRIDSFEAILAEIEDLLEELDRLDIRRRREPAATARGNVPSPSMGEGKGEGEPRLATAKPVAGDLPAPEERVLLQVLALRQENLDLARLLSRLSEIACDEHLVLRRLTGAGAYDERGRTTAAGSSLGLSLQG